MLLLTAGSLGAISQNNGIDLPDEDIALTSNSPETLERYQKLLKEYESIVVYETAKYSLNELNDIRYSVFKILAKEHPITKHYVDVIENKIVFEFLELNEKGINASISSAMRNTAFKNTLPSDF